MRVINIYNLSDSQHELVMYVGHNPSKYGFDASNSLPILSNFYTHRPALAEQPGMMSVPNREKAIELYDRWLIRAVESNNYGVMKALSQLRDYHLLGCFCDPKPCHASAIIRVWEKYKSKGFLH